jgi:hypothetical protein
VAKKNKFDLSDLEKLPLEQFNQIYLLTVAYKEAPCQKMLLKHFREIGTYLKENVDNLAMEKLRCSSTQWS